MKDSVANGKETTVEKALRDVLPKTFHNEQRDIRPFEFIIVEQDMLDLLRKDVIGEMLDVHNSKFFETGEATEELSNRCLKLTF